MLQPFPGTVDFAKWEKEASAAVTGRVDAAVALLADSARRPAARSTAPHPAMSADEIRQRTQATWDEFYRLPLDLEAVARGASSRCVPASCSC